MSTFFKPRARFFRMNPAEVVASRWATIRLSASRIRSCDSIVRLGQSGRRARRRAGRIGRGGGQRLFGFDAWRPSELTPLATELAPLRQPEQCRNPDYRHGGERSRRCDDMGFVLHRSGPAGTPAGPGRADPLGPGSPPPGPTPAGRGLPGRSTGSRRRGSRPARPEDTFVPTWKETITGP